MTQLPGVASSTVGYDPAWWKSEHPLDVAVVLDHNATPEQAHAIGSRFDELVHTKDFADSEIDLVVQYHVVDGAGNLPVTSSARFDYPPGQWPTTLPDALREWLTIAQSPGVQSAGVTQPAADGSPAGNAFRVTVDKSAKDEDLQALVRNHPHLNGAAWVLVAGTYTRGSVHEPDHPEVYQLIGMIPDQRLRELWSRIVAELGAAGEVAARTDLSGNAATRPPTTVNVNFPSATKREEDLAQGWMTLTLLEGLPKPAKVDFNGDIFILGGCSAPDAPSTHSDLEKELRHKFERC